MKEKKVAKARVKATGVELEILTIRAVMRAVGQLPTVAARVRLLEYAEKLCYDQMEKPGQLSFPGAAELVVGP